ncbi:hypothetical protein B566_EDAN008891 [Ephemera danica]|nr:hypothetical protein B566_EDAN008891 [Ephemera danica]
MKDDWHRRMEGFKGDGQKYKMRLPSILPQKKQENLSQASSTIHWSSSDDEEEKSKPLVVVRLDFGKCVQGSAGHVKPQVSRSLVTKTTLNDNSICSNSSADPCSPLKCSQKYDDIDSPSSPLQPSILTTPKSPIISCRRKTPKCNTNSPLNGQNEIETTPELVRPKSPIISIARKQKRVKLGKTTNDTEESQILTARAVSPILSKSRHRKSIPQPKSLSPVLNRRKKKKLTQPSNVRKNLDSTSASSQLVSQVHTQKNLDVTGIILETNSQVENINQSKKFDDGSQNLSFEDDCTQNVDALDQCQSITLQCSQQAAHAPIIEECSPNDSYAQYVNIVHTQQPPAVDSVDHLEHSFAVPCSPRIVQGLSQEVQIEDSSQEIDSGTPNVDEFPSQESYSFMHSASKTDGEEYVIQEIPPSSSSQSTIVSTTDNLLDRSKKRRPRKMIRNGLAMQLKRALARQRSTQCMWQHERFRKLENSNDEGQKLAVTNVKYEFRRILVHVDQPTSYTSVATPEKEDQMWKSHYYFSPLQFDHPRLGIPVLFGVNLIELESMESTNTHLPAPTPQVPSNLVRQVFTCPCRQATNRDKINSIDRELTIASAVRSHANNPATPLQLLLCCQRVYCYRLPSNLAGLTSQSSNSENSSQSSSTQLWQALGQDLKGEMCLVELGRHSDSLLEGSLFHLQNLSIVKRLQVARNPGLQSILSNINPQHKQSVVFLFSATHSEAPRLIEGPTYPSWISPQLSSQTQSEIFIDRYSAVIDFKTIPKSQASPWMTRLLSRKFSSQPVMLPSPGDDSSLGDLVTVEGAIKNVDENSACVWPVCGACSSEVLREVDENSQSLECVLCGSRGPFPNNVALTVELNLPGHVKVKTYDIESVLDHHLGPFMCIVSEKSRNGVTLMEVPQDAEFKTL